jgi:UrcA family protein
MSFVRLSLPLLAAAGLSVGLAAPAQAQYADDPPYAYAPPAPAYYPPPPAYYPPAAAAYAPPPAYAAPTVGEVIIRAPYRRSERDAATGAPVERVSASRVVSYTDLDLTTDWGVHELHYRIVRAAQDACDSIDRHYDVMEPGDRECVANAVRDAMHQAPIGYASDAAYEGP